MATLNGVNYAQTHAPSDGNWKLVPVSEVGGQLRLIYDTYTCVTATAAADVLNVGRLPKDSRVWDVHVTTSVTLRDFAGVPLEKLEPALTTVTQLGDPLPLSHLIHSPSSPITGPHL